MDAVDVAVCRVRTEAIPIAAIAVNHAGFAGGFNS